MINFLDNIEVYKLIDEYYITTKELMTITIRVIEVISGAQDFAFKATPYFTLFDSPATPKYQGVGATPEDALQSCLNVINGVPLVEMLTALEVQQKAARQ